MNDLSFRWILAHSVCGCGSSSRNQPARAVCYIFSQDEPDAIISSQFGCSYRSWHPLHFPRFYPLSRHPGYYQSSLRICERAQEDCEPGTCRGSTVDDRALFDQCDPGASLQLSRITRTGAIPTPFLYICRSVTRLAELLRSSIHYS